jgi:Tol biopolymer transport system component
MKWVIFQASPPGEKNYQMYVAPLALSDGASSHIGQPIRLSPPNSRNTCGYFAPNGESLIFASTAGKEDPNEPTSGYQRQGGNYRWDFPKGMEIYQAKNWASSVAGSPKEVDLAKPESRLTNNDAYDAEGAYSPDGKWICFTSFRTGDSEIWVMRSDGSNPVQITHAKGYDGGPFFSPDGKRLVYRSDRKGNDLLQIFVADLAFDGQGNVTGLKAEHQLTNDQNVNWGPYWHPDGHHLIFATSRHGHQNYELYAIRDDGSHATRITYCDRFDGLPVFSPDGNYLMWSSKRTADNTTQLFLARFHPPTDW